MSFDLGEVIGANAPKITDIEKTSTSGLVDTYTITLEDGSSYTFDVTNGADGSTVSVTQVLSTGTKLATITIDGTPTDLYCSEGGTADIVTSWESTLSDTKVPSEKLTKETIDTKASISSLSTVATSGSYTDLSNKPSIPSSSSDLSDGSDLIKKSNTTGLVKNDGSIDTTSYISSLPSASTSTSGIVQLVDNLTTNDDTKALTAKQGKAIADLIGDAITYINQ